MIGYLWVSLIIDQLECLVCYYFCTELTLFCTELPENCIYLNQSDLSNFFMYIIRAEIIRMTSKLNKRAARVRFKNHKFDFRRKLHDTRFNYHFITSILKTPKDRTWSNILLMQYWAGLKLNSSIFWGKKIRVFWKQKMQNLLHDTLCLSFSCNLIGYFKQALKSVWLFCF